LIAFQRDLEEFKELDAQIIGVSGDSLETNTRFADENGIAYPLVSDDDRSIKKKYGRGRVTYLIDKNGVIRFIQKGVPDNHDFVTQLKQLK
jgi:peroxiredoxin Q/BCP